MIEIALTRRSPEERTAWMEGYEAGRHLRLDTLQDMLDAAYDKGFKRGYDKRMTEEAHYGDTDSIKIKKEDKDK